MAHIWTSLLFFSEMLRSAITYLFCFGGKSTGVDLFASIILTPSIKKLLVIAFSKKAWTYIFCVYVHLFDMKTKKNVLKKLRRPGFEPIIYVSVAMLTNHKTTVKSTTTLSYQWISSQLYQDVYFRNCSKHTVCTRSITKNHIFSVRTVIIYSCIKVRIRLIW